MEEHQGDEWGMPERRIWALLRALDQNDLRDLEPYAKQPAVCKDTNTLKLLKQLIQWAPKKNAALVKQMDDAAPLQELPQKWLNRQGLHNRVFRNAAFKEKVWLKLLRNIHELLEEFIAWKKLRKDPTKVKQYVCEHFMHLDEEELFKHQWKNWAEALAEEPEGHNAFFQNLMLHLAWESHWSFDRQGKPATGFPQAQERYAVFLNQGALQTTKSNQSIMPKLKQRKPKDATAGEYRGYTDQKNNPKEEDHTSPNRKNKARYESCEVPSSQDNLAEEPLYETPQEDNTNTQTTTYTPRETPVLPALYEQLDQLMGKPTASEGDWQTFAQHYKASFQKLDRIQQRVLFDVQINSYINRFQKGEKNYIEHLLDLHQWVEDQKAFAQNWIFSPNDFLNCVFAAGIAGNRDNIRRLIGQFGNKLPSSLRQNTLDLAEAYCAYCHKNWALAKQHLGAIRQHRLVFALRQHSLELRIAYEQLLSKEDNGDIQGILEKYEAYFKGKKGILSEDRQRSYLRLGYFVDLMQKEVNKRRGFGAGYRSVAKEELFKKFHDPEQPRPIAYAWVKAQIERLWPEGA